jgi:hypothetical protein
VSYRPNAICPKCSRPPAIRFHESAVRAARSAEEDDPWEDVVCTKCGTAYMIAAWAVQQAELEIRVQPRKVVDAAKRTT